MPPGWPVFQALSMSSASRAAHLADDDAVGPQPQRRAHEVGHATPTPVPGCAARRHRRAAHCSSRVSSIRITRSSRSAISASSALASVVLPDDWCRRRRGCSAARRTRLATARRPRDRHDAVGDIVVERVDLRRRLADREAGRARYRRQHALEALAGPLRRAAAVRPRRSAPRMGLGCGRGEATRRMIRSTLAADRASPRVDAALAEPVEPQAPVGVDHDLDDRGIGERGGDRRPHGGAQHRAAAAQRTGCDQLIARRLTMLGAACQAFAWPLAIASPHDLRRRRR